MKKSYQTLIDLLTIFFASLTPLLWFRDKTILTGFDSGFPLNPLVHFLDRLFLWTNRFGFGRDQTMEAGGFFIHLEESTLQFFGFTLQQEQKIIFISWFFLLGIAVYIFSRVLFDYRKYRYLALFAALFYMFNTYTIQSWPVAERTKFSLMIALPLLFSVLIKFFRDHLSVFKTASLMGLILFFFNAGGANGVPHFAAMAILFLAGFLFLFFTSWGETKISFTPFFISKVFLFSLLTAVLFLLLNSYWLMPLWHFVQTSYSAAIGARGDISGSLAWLDVVSNSTSILNLLRLQGEPGWYGIPTTHPYGQLYLQNPVLVLVSFLWPALAFCAVIFSKKIERKQIIFLLLIALTAIFFSAGSHYPTGIIFDFLFRYVPGFLVLRSAWFKFNYGISLGYSVLIAYFISRVYLWLQTKKQIIVSWILLTAFLLTIGLYNFPYFSSKMFVWNKPLSLMVEVPSYVFDFGNWVQTLPPSARFLALPPLDKQWSGLAYSWNYFSSTTPQATLTNRAMFYNYESTTQNEKELLLSLYDDIMTGKEEKAQKTLSLLGMQYLLLQKDTLSDLGWYKTISSAEIERKLGQLYWLSREKVFGKWEVYKLQTMDKTPLISFADNVVLTNLSAKELMLISPDDIKNAELYFDTTNKVSQINNFIWKTECLNCQMEKIDFFLPQVRILPGTLFYKFFVEDKENKLLKNAMHLEFSQKIDLYLGLALKRLAEIDRLTELGKDTQTLVPLEKLKTNLLQIENLLKTATVQETDLIPSQKRLVNFSQFAQDKINFFQSRNTKGSLQPKIKEISGQLSFLDNLIMTNSLWRDTNRKLFLTNVPVSGRYAIKQLENPSIIVKTTIDQKEIGQNQFIDLAAGQHVIEANFLASFSDQANDNFVLVSQNSEKKFSSPLTTIKRIDQTKYLLTVENIPKEFWLYFKDSFSRNWIVYVDDKPISPDRHFTANGYANAWFISKEDFRREGVHTIVLAYLPQSFFQLGMVISGATFIVLIFALTINAFLERRYG